jgi:hypothetical protein
MQHFGFEMALKDGIDTLLALDAPQTRECWADNYRLEMSAVSRNGKIAAFDSDTDPFLDLLGLKHRSTP